MICEHQGQLAGKRHLTEIHDCGELKKRCVPLRSDAAEMIGADIASCEGCPLFKPPTGSVSCILPTYNLPERLELVAEAVESFFRQDYPHKELIIVSDQEIAFSHPDVKILVGKWATLGEKLNAAIAISSGELICRFDDDDISMPNRISSQVRDIKGFDYVTPTSIWCIYQGKLEWQRQRGYGHSQGMFRRSAFDSCGGYSATSGNEDAIMHGKMTILKWNKTDETSYIYRWHNGISGHGSAENMQAAFNRNVAKGEPGPHELKPHWNEDYVKLTGQTKFPIPDSAIKVDAKICVIGYPSKYGGADTELDHQMTCWRAMGVEVHVIPTSEPDAAQLSLGVAERGCIVHKARDWSACQGMHVISYCNGDFLSNLLAIRRYARSTTFVNCMTWLFDKEKEAHSLGLIDVSMYQTDHARALVEPELRRLNPRFQWAKVRPYFDLTAFPYHQNKDNSAFRFCRVSRDDPAKFSKETFHIFNEFESPVPKKGVVLGIKDAVYAKCGQPPSFVECLPAGGRSAGAVYANADVLIQSCDTYENLPRVAMEAMSSGCVPIVDNRGGWREIVDNGVTGFLCGSTAEFIEKATYLANNPDRRILMGMAGLTRLIELYGIDSAAEQWAAYFKMLEQFPEKKAWTDETLVERVQWAIEDAEKGISNLPANALKMEGMSSAKVRHFLNNLRAKKYLEIGSWKGSTAVAAVIGNGIAYCIDNWSQFGGPKADFERNTAGLNVKLIDQDCMTVDRSTLPDDFDVFFYDGDHSPEVTRAAIAAYASNLASEAIIVVDDTNFAGVTDASRAAFVDAGLTVQKEWLLPAKHNGDREEWWNGVLVAVVSKSSPENQPKMGLLARAKSLLSVTTQTVLDKVQGGEGLLSPEQIQARLDICNTCPLLGANGKCSVCGCDCNGRAEWLNKLAHPASECPASPPKWNKIID